MASGTNGWADRWWIKVERGREIARSRDGELESAKDLFSLFFFGRCSLALVFVSSLLRSNGGRHGFEGMKRIAMQRR